ncbi:MAG: 1-acyl-sn-glycerol-3-phosphate acyltransferase [Balneolaceae bacterium]|nr:1-acyl-sn-glycerol-3-phosphate acyltransferase [Balneolaceae bacterium]
MEQRIRGWTFTHFWVRPVVKVWFSLYHKSVTYSGTEHVDWDKPIIFAPSHQNAFSDALCLILPTRYTNDRFIYPLIRADAFGNSRMLDWILTAFHMMPVYRPRDEVDIRAKNDSVFGHCYQILAKNHNLLIHPEGNCIPRKRVRPFKKGLARIALGAEEAHGFSLGVQVVPVGINYRSITEARRGIHVRYAPPIRVAELEEMYLEHPAQAITRLTRQTQRGVEQVTFHIGSSDRYEETEHLIQIVSSNSPGYSAGTPYRAAELETGMQVERALRSREKSGQDIAENLRKRFAALREQLDKWNLDPRLPLRGNSHSRSLLLELLLFLTISPLWIYGWGNSVIPWKLTNMLAGKVGELQFKSSARMVIGLLLFPFSYLMQTGLVGAATGNWEGALVYLVSLPFTGIFARNGWEYLQEWLQKWRLSRMPRQQRGELAGMIDELFSEFGSGRRD